MLFSLHFNFVILECRNFANFNFAFSQCFIGICQAYDGQTEFSWVFNVADFNLLAKFPKILCVRK